MNDIAEAMTLNFFAHARMGWEHTGRLLYLLEQAGVRFEDCSYSDTRGEYDITFVFKDVAYRLIGGCGSTLEFHSIGNERGWSMRPNPPNVETIAYRMIARLHGEKIDYQHVLSSDLPFSWYGKGEVWLWRDGLDWVAG